VNCGAITSSGALGLGSNAVNCGAITSSGALSLGSNPIVCGSLTASGDVTWPRNNLTVGFASPASAQSIGNSVTATISWTTKFAGTGITFSGAATTITLPSAGWYTLSCSFTYAANVTGVRSVWFLINGATLPVQLAMNTTNGVGGSPARIATRVQGQFAAGDTVAVQTFQSSGGNLSIGNDGNLTRFEINRVHD
jgi:hypothetical protein